MEEEDFEYYEEEVGELDQKSKCRLCGLEEKSKFLINIFGKAGRKYALDIKIRKCLPIVIREDDGMPKGVCLSCVNKLDVSWELVESSLRAHRNFLSVLAYDPVRARAEVMAERGEGEESVDDQTEIFADDLSDSASTQLDDYNELPVVIKEEPMDVEDMESITLDYEEADDSVQENDLDNVLVTSVKSIPKSSTSHTQQNTESLSMRLMQSLKESALRRNSLQPGDVTIKEEPIGSPPHNLILAESEAEKLSELQEIPQPATPTLNPPEPIQT